MKDKLKSFFSEKKVLILGFGREGMSTLELIKDFDCTIAISDKSFNTETKIESYKLYGGHNYLSCLDDDFDIIVKTPGIALFDTVTEEVKQKITSQTDLLLRFCENTIIGITGTKGKSTTSSLVHHILESCGKKALLIGNIGIPPLAKIDEFEEDTILVCEMSCHQLEYVKASPDIAVLLNIYEEHLDHYSSFAAYKYAKENIFRHLEKNDTLICNANCLSDEVKALPCEVFSAALDETADIFADKEKISICGIDAPLESISTKLVGHHNYYNIAVALACAVFAGCEIDSAIRAVGTFCGLEHRLELVKTINGIRYINDSISTIPLAAVSAVKAFENADTIIIGGMDRGISYELLIDFLNDSSVKNVICLKDSGYKVYERLDRTKLNAVKAIDLPDAVRIASEVTKHCCVFSPAAASYGFYKNFEERGKHFKELVNLLQ